jgi:pantetheine-phosphate adenylyltransferase
MKTIAIYPGSFCPPTYGHYQIVRRAAGIFKNLTIVCSRNPDKSETLFSEKECKELWRHYCLPAKIKVKTLSEFIEENKRPEDIIMIRGIRDEDDFDYEKNIVFSNFAEYKIDKYFYLVSGNEYSKISSSKARQAALKGGEDLTGLISPSMISEMMAKINQLKTKG